MSDYEQAVFISYAWGAEREDIVNEIDETLQKRGIGIVRDKRALGYKGSIKEFMERIGQGHCVIVVISDKYLRSPNCMFELVEIAENKQFHDRVFPIVLSDANIYDPIKRIEYVKHWEAKRKELARAMKALDPANLQGIRDDMDQYDRIRDKISGITSILKDMNTLTPEMHRDFEFSDLYDAIVERLKENSKDPSAESDHLVAAQKAEEQRLAKQKAGEELAAKAEAERKAKEEAAHLAAQKAEAERIARQVTDEELAVKAQAEAERKAKNQAEILAKQKIEADVKVVADLLSAQKAEANRLAKQKTGDVLTANANAENKKLTSQNDKTDNVDMMQNNIIGHILLLAVLWSLTLTAVNTLSRVFGLEKISEMGFWGVVAVDTLVFCFMSLGYCLSLLAVLNLRNVHLANNQKVLLITIWLLACLPIDILGQSLFLYNYGIAGWRLGYVIYGVLTGCSTALLFNKAGYRFPVKTLGVGFAIAFIIGDTIFTWVSQLSGLGYYDKSFGLTYIPTGIVTGLLGGWLVFRQSQRRN